MDCLQDHCFVLCMKSPKEKPEASWFSGAWGEKHYKKAAAPFVCGDRMTRMLMQWEIVLIGRNCL